MPQPNKPDALALARADLAAYASAIWPPFELARHHRLIIEELERVERGETDRLMIAMPPRHGKSLLTSQVFPAWYLGRHPDRSIIASSYGMELASDFGRRVRNFVAEPLHRQIFPGCAIAEDSSAAHRFGLLAGGNYFATGAGGAITGRGGDLVLVDDPIKSHEQVRSSTERRSLQQWYESVLYTRLQPRGAIVLIATRWHHDDLPGWLLREHASENWRVLSLPAIAEKDEGWRHEGEVLWPEKFPLETLDRIREAIGSSAWASLYQQRPVLEEGAIFKREWFRFFQDREPPECRRIVMSIDSAYKVGQQNDFSVLMVLGQTQTGYYVLHTTRERLEFPELKRKAIALGEIWSPHYCLVEDAASGQSLIQALRAETRLPILPVKPLGDKQARASAVSPLVESGRVYLPENAPWLRDFIDELTSFPVSVHDDQVDAFSQGLNYLRGEGYRPIEYIPGPRVSRRGAWDGQPVGDRLYANGQAVAAAEDAAVSRQRARWGRFGRGGF